MLNIISARGTAKHEGRNWDFLVGVRAKTFLLELKIVSLFYDDLMVPEEDRLIPDLGPFRDMHVLQDFI